VLNAQKTEGVLCFYLNVNVTHLSVNHNNKTITILVKMLCLYIEVQIFTSYTLTNLKQFINAYSTIAEKNEYVENCVARKFGFVFLRFDKS